VSVWGTVYTPELFPGSSRLHSESINFIQLSTFVTSGRLTNINVIPIDYAFRPRLRGRLTLRRLTLHRKPWTFGGNVSRISLRYLCQHSHLWYLQHASQHAFNGLHNAPLPLACGKSASSVYGFSPVTFSAQSRLFRLVSCYAFFKGWLLLSQPPSCYGVFTSFNT